MLFLIWSVTERWDLGTVYRKQHICYDRPSVHKETSEYARCLPKAKAALTNPGKQLNAIWAGPRWLSYVH